MYQAMSDLVTAHDDVWSATTAAKTGLPQLTLAPSGANGNPKDISNLVTDLSTRASQAYVPAQLSQLETLTGVQIINSSGVAKAYTEASNFIKTYQNGFIGFGPYYVSAYQAATTPNYAILTANPNFKLGPYLLPQLFAPASQISVSTTIPSILTEGSTVPMTTLSTLLGQKVATPQSNVKVVVQLVNSSAVVNQQTIISGANGSLTYTVPTVPPGAYSLTIYASSANSTIIVPSTYTATLVSATNTSSTNSTTVSVSTGSSSTGSATASSSSTSSGTSSVSSTASSSSTSSGGLPVSTLTLAAVVIVIVIIAGVAVVVLRRR